MSKAIMEVVDIRRGQKSAEVIVNFSISEGCGVPIANFSRTFSIPIESSTSEKEIELAALDKAKEVLDKEYPT